MIGDEVFYHLYQDGKLQGAILTHFDDFTIARTEDCVEKILMGVSNQMTLSKVKRDKFIYTSIFILLKPLYSK